MDVYKYKFDQAEQLLWIIKDYEYLHHSQQSMATLIRFLNIYIY